MSSSIDLNDRNVHLNDGIAVEQLVVDKQLKELVILSRVVWLKFHTNGSCFFYDFPTILTV